MQMLISLHSSSIFLFPLLVLACCLVRHLCRRQIRKPSSYLVKNEPVFQPVFATNALGNIFSSLLAQFSLLLIFGVVIEREKRKGERK